jgi:hypothetical protein
MMTMDGTQGREEKKEEGREGGRGEQRRKYEESRLDSAIMMIFQG